MKKLLIISMCLALSLACTTVGLAAETDRVEEPLERAQQYAYMDLEEASPEMQEKILEARREIIYSEEWVADGYTMSVVDMDTGETVREIPAFSEVFPGWDLPVEKETSAIESTDIDIGIGDGTWIEIDTVENVYVPRATASGNAPNFFEETIDPYEQGTSVRVSAESLYGISMYNIGLTDLTTGRSIGYTENLSINEGVRANGLYYVNLGIRARTHASNSGRADFLIEGAYRAHDIR